MMENAEINKQSYKQLQHVQTKIYLYQEKEFEHLLKEEQEKEEKKDE